jgi:hypothetical protein
MQSIGELLPMILNSKLDNFQIEDIEKKTSCPNATKKKNIA